MKKNGKVRIILRNRTLHRFLILVIILFNSTNMFSQNRTVNLSLTDTTVLAAISEIRNQSDFNFIFSHNEVEKQPRITISIENASVEEALKAVLKNTNLEFEKLNTNIVIKPKSTSPPPQKPKGKTQTQTIRGKVIDRDTKLSLPYANVVVVNTSPQKGVITDDDGYFRIEELPVGRYTIQVSFLGYENAILSEILVGTAKEVVLQIELSESAMNMDDVVVSVKKGQPLNEMAMVSSKSFSVEESKRYAASISDPARMALSFAGVSTSDDASNEIVIRGNSPNWVSWRLEGVEIPSPNHFAEEGYSSGAVSILSTNTLGKSDFYTGAFPSEYGNALSGVFDIKLRNGNTEQREYSAQLGLLGIELAAEGPFKKGYRGSYLINYRYSTLSLLNHLGLEISENTLPNYQDLSFKVNLPTKKAGTFSVWGIGGASYADEKFLPDTTQDQEFEDGYSDYTTTGMFATGLGHTIYVDDRSYIKTVAAYTQRFSSNTYDLMDSTGQMNDYYYDDFNTSAIRINTFYNRKFTKKLTLRSGINFSKLYYSYFSKHNENDGWETNLDSDGNTNLYEGYIQTKIKPNDKFVLTAGLHYTHFALSSDNSIEPRIGMEYNFKHRQKIGIGAGLHSSNENLPAYFIQFENPDGSVSKLNKSLKLTRSAHAVFSYEKQLWKNWAFKTEIYYQYIYDLPVPNNPNKPLAPSQNGVSSNDTLVNEGVGMNYGIEFTLQRYFNKGFYVLVSSSLFESKYKPINDKWYNSKYNLNFVNNLVGGKEINWGTNKMISLNGKLIWTGGQRYIPINLEESIAQGAAVYEVENAYSNQLSDYFRIDLGIKLHFFRKKVEHIVSIDVQNVTNHLNDWFQIYDSKNEKIIEYPMAGIIPILNYRIEF